MRNRDPLRQTIAFLKFRFLIDVSELKDGSTTILTSNSCVHSNSDWNVWQPKIGIGVIELGEGLRKQLEKAIHSITSHKLRKCSSLLLCHSCWASGHWVILAEKRRYIITVATPATDQQMQTIRGPAGHLEYSTKRASRLQESPQLSICKGKSGNLPKKRSGVAKVLE